MATTPPTPDPFDEVRSAFADLETSEKAAFVFEATFATLGQALHETGRRVAEVIDDLDIDAWFRASAADDVGAPPPPPPVPPPPAAPSTRVPPPPTPTPPPPRRGMNDKSWIERYERASLTQRAGMIGGGAVRLAALAIDRALDRAASLAVEAKEAFDKELDPNVSDARILEETDERDSA